MKIKTEGQVIILNNFSASALPSAPSVGRTAIYASGSLVYSVGADGRRFNMSSPTILSSGSSTTARQNLNFIGFPITDNPSGSSTDFNFNNGVLRFFNSASQVLVSGCIVSASNVSMSGDVSIGTLSAIERISGWKHLTVKGDSSGSGSAYIQIITARQDADAIGAGLIGWFDGNSTNTSARLAYINVLTAGSTAGKRGSAMSFGTKPDNDTGQGIERVRIDNAGNFGIGTTTPKSPLHVVGLPTYANNAAAISGGLTAGAFYRNNADPDLVCVVH